MIRLLPTDKLRAKISRGNIHCDACEKELAFRVKHGIAPVRENSGLIIYEDSNGMLYGYDSKYKKVMEVKS